MTKAQMLAALEGIDSAVEVKFKAIGPIEAGSTVPISTTLTIINADISRSVAPAGVDTNIDQDLVILEQG